MMQSNNDIWKIVLEMLSSELTPTTVNTWFDDARMVELTDNLLILHTPSDFKRDIIKKRYGESIKNALREIFSADFQVEILGESDLAKYEPQKGSSPEILREEFTFDNFVVGSSNKYAHAAALYVAEHPAEKYNPLYLYGEPGLGKTHLLYAISNVIRRNHPEFRIVYIRGEEFTNELVSAIQTGKNFEFRDKYRTADLFLMDDIQFISGKERTQEEFFHTFNSLFQASKQIVLTSDRAPKHMAQLEERLRSRFEGGLIWDIQPPDYETRIAIITKKAQQLRLELSDKQKALIAENITENVRQLEGAVKKLRAYTQLSDDEVTVALIDKVVAEIKTPPKEKDPSPDLIIEEVCRYYQVTVDELKSQRKTSDLANARQVAMYIMRSMTRLSLQDIGNVLSRDHTTIMHGERKVLKLMKDSSSFNNTIKEITANIENRA